MTEEAKRNLTKATPHGIDGFDGYTAATEGADSDNQGAPGSVIQGMMIKYTK
jgi:hypothetical protein